MPPWQRRRHPARLAQLQEGKHWIKPIALDNRVLNESVFLASLLSPFSFCRNPRVRAGGVSELRANYLLKSGSQFWTKVMGAVFSLAELLITNLFPFGETS